MLDLRPDGTVALDFDSETVVIKPPKVGGYRRLRKELYDIDTRQATYNDSLAETTSEQERRNLNVEFHEQGLLDWWKLILIGNDTFKTLVEEGTVPPDENDWPLALAENTAAISAIGHWVTSPLHYGSQPAPSTNDPAPPADPS